MFVLCEFDMILNSNTKQKQLHSFFSGESTCVLYTQQKEQHISTKDTFAIISNQNTARILQCYASLILFSKLSNLMEKETIYSKYTQCSL